MTRSGSRTSLEKGQEGTLLWMLYPQGRCQRYDKTAAGRDFVRRELHASAGYMCNAMERAQFEGKEEGLERGNVW
jgi:hypothetical protein